MKPVNLYKKQISMFVVVAFTIMLCFWANQAPAASEKGSSATMEKSEGEASGFIEQEEDAPAIKKGKKFPWLIAALVVIAGGAALYFLVLKKKNYTLTVTVGEGVTGAPAAGTSTNKKGTVVNYDYSLQSGYSDLSVTLDGASVATSGTVTMNADHTLEARSTKTFVLTVSTGEHVTGTPASGAHTYARGTNVPYNYAPASGFSNLEVKLDNVLVANAGTIAMDTNHTLTANLYGANIVLNSTPAGARIYLDNVDSGFTTPHSFFFTTAVTKNVVLRPSCGYKDFSQSISANLGQIITVNANLIAGIREDFDIPASSCWHPYYSASWSTNTHGEYRYIGSAPKYSTNYYNLPFSGDYALTVRMTRVTGSAWATGLFLGTSTSSTNAFGYIFSYYPNTPPGEYGIYRWNGYNFISASGPYTLIKAADSAAVKCGLNQFNILKIVKTGSNYSFYINSTLMHTFTDSTYNPTYCALVFYCGSVATHMEFEFVYLDTASGGMVQGLPVKNQTANEKEFRQRDPATGEKRE